MKRRRLRNIASACSSGSGDSTPVLASLPEIAEEKTILPITVPFGIGAPFSIPLTGILFLFAISSLPRFFRARGLLNQYHADAIGVYSAWESIGKGFLAYG